MTNRELLSRLSMRYSKQKLEGDRLPDLLSTALVPPRRLYPRQGSRRMNLYEHLSEPGRPLWYRYVRAKAVRIPRQGVDEREGALDV